MKTTLMTLALAIACVPAFAEEPALNTMHLNDLAVTQAADHHVGPVEVTDRILCGVQGTTKTTVHGLAGVRFVKEVEGSGVLSCVGHHPRHISVKGAGFAPGVSIELLLGFFRGETSAQSESVNWTTQVALPIGANPEILGGTWRLQGGIDVGGFTLDAYVPSSITAPGVVLGLPRVPSLSAGINISTLKVKVTR